MPTSSSPFVMMSSLLAQNKVISLGEASLLCSLFTARPALPCSHPCLLCLYSACLDNNLAPCRQKNHGATRGNGDADAPLSLYDRGVWVYGTTIASEWGCCVGRCCPGASIHQTTGVEWRQMTDKIISSVNYKQWADIWCNFLWLCRLG